MLNVSIMNILITIVNILILYFVLRKFLFGRIDAILKQRQEEVDSATEAADKAIEEARQAKNDYERKLKKSEEEKDKIIADIKKQGYDEYDKIVTEARKKGDKIIIEAKANALTEAERAKEEYASDIKDMVIDAASKIAATGRNTEEDLKLYDKFIDEAGAAGDE